MSSLVLGVVAAGLAAAVAAGLRRLRHLDAAARTASDLAPRLQAAAVEATAALAEVAALPRADPADAALDAALDAGFPDPPDTDGAAAERRPDGRRRTRSTRPPTPAPRLRRDP